MPRDKLDGPDTRWEWMHFSKICTHCSNMTDIVGRRCRAFPDGIPRPIWLGENNHKKPYPGDHGIRFDPARKG